MTTHRGTRAPRGSFRMDVAKYALEFRELGASVPRCAGVLGASISAQRLTIS